LRTCASSVGGAVDAATERLLGTPAAVLRLHRVFLLEAVFALILLPALLGVFVATDARSMPGSFPMLLLVGVMCLMTAAQLSFLCAEERRCRIIVHELAGEPALVAEAMASLLNSRCCRNLRFVTMFLSIWYLLSMFWAATLPPCALIPDESFDKQALMETSQSAFCRATGMSFPVLLIGNSVLGYAMAQAMQLHDGSPPAAAPPGVPANLLQRLPSYEVGSPEAPPRDAEAGQQSCAICIEDFSAGERVKRLPCGHKFHAHCADDWLSRAASCPMRCPGDLIAALGGGGGETRSKMSVAVAALVARTGGRIIGRPARREAAPTGA